MSRKDRVLGDVLTRYDKMMSDCSFDSRDRHFKRHQKPRSASVRKPRACSPESTSSAGGIDKAHRKARAWSSMVRSVGPEIRNKLLQFWGDQPMALDVLDSSHKFSNLLGDLENNGAARDDFLMLLQMMEDRHASISSSSLKKIAIEVGAHHLRRMLDMTPYGGPSKNMPLGYPMGPPGPPPPHPMMGGMPPPELGHRPGDIYSDLKYGIDKIQDTHFHLNMQNLNNSAKKSEVERSLMSELRRRNEDLKDTREDLKVDRLKLASENAEQKKLIEQLQCDLKIANEVADQQSKRARETEDATKRELETLDSGIRDLEAKLADLSTKNAVLSEEKESYKAHNDALLKEVERQDKVIRKLGRQVDSFSTVGSDVGTMVEPMFKLVRSLKERLDEYDVMRERLSNNIRDIRDDKEYAYRVGDLVVEMTTSRLWRIMEQYTDNNGRFHSHIEELQDMTRHMDKAMEGIKDDARHADVN